MRRVGVASFALALAAVLVGCGPSNVAAGFIIGVESTSITEVDSFVLRTSEGTELTFRVGTLELGNAAFPATHLREHMALNQPVAVAFREDEGVLVAYRLKDAPWLDQ